MINIKPFTLREMQPFLSKFTQVSQASALSGFSCWPAIGEEGERGKNKGKKEEKGKNKERNIK